MQKKEPHTYVFHVANLVVLVLLQGALELQFQRLSGLCTERPHGGILCTTRYEVGPIRSVVAVFISFLVAPVPAALAAGTAIYDGLNYGTKKGDTCSNGFAWTKKKILKIYGALRTNLKNGIITHLLLFCWAARYCAIASGSISSIK